MLAVEMERQILKAAGVTQDVNPKQVFFLFFVSNTLSPPSPTHPFPVTLQAASTRDISIKYGSMRAVDVLERVAMRPKPDVFKKPPRRVRHHPKSSQTAVVYTNVVCFSLSTPPHPTPPLKMLLLLIPIPHSHNTELCIPCLYNDCVRVYPTKHKRMADPCLG